MYIFSLNGNDRYWEEFLMKKNDKNKIKCDVKSCKHNDQENNCELESIEVSCTCDNCDCQDSKETVCNSFDCDEENKNLTDNEYEVESESSDNYDEESEDEDYDYEEDEDEIDDEESNEKSEEE